MAFVCKPNNKPLREALDAPDGFPVSEHRARTDGIRKLHPHTVTFQKLVDESTCVLYAFGLVGNSIYRAIATNFGGQIFAGKAFMEWLIKGHLVEIAAPKEGCLAMYFAKGVWKHVGVVVKSGRVISQWGTFPVYEHDVCELPARYGGEVRYFEMPGRGEPLQLFLEFAKTLGVSEADLAKAKRA
jgi:hypothetical protein